MKGRKMNTYERKHWLYKQYLLEFQKLGLIKITKNDEEIKAYVDSEFINNKEYKWINLFNDDNTICGFLLIQRREGSNPLFYISESYILPQERKKGIMLSAIQDFVSRHAGRYQSFVLKGNDEKVWYWKKTFSKCGYKLHSCLMDDAGDGYELIFHPAE